MERRVIFVEGAIGCGKSTVLDACPDAFVCVRENLDVWRELSYPRLAYESPKEHAWLFQSLVLATQQHDLAAALQSDAHTIVVERSVVSNTIFAEMLHEDGMISEQQMAVYRQQHKAALLAMKMLCAGCHVQHIWLDVATEECLSRLKQRNAEEEDKDGESAVDYTYLQRLYLKHNKTFSEQTTALGSVQRMASPSVDAVVQNMLFTKLH